MTGKDSYDTDIPEDELEIHVEEIEAGQFIARVFHKPTSTIKISDIYDIRDQAIDAAIDGLKTLISQRRQGLG